MGKILILVGLVIVGFGILMVAGVPLGRLPGDVVYRRGHTTVYLPIATCVLLSVAITFVMMLFRR